MKLAIAVLAALLTLAFIVQLLTPLSMALNISVVECVGGFVAFGVAFRKLPQSDSSLTATAWVLLVIVGLFWYIYGVYGILRTGFEN